MSQFNGSSLFLFSDIEFTFQTATPEAIYASVDLFTDARMIERIIRCIEFKLLSIFLPHIISPAMAADIAIRSSSGRELMVFITSSLITNVLLMA